MSPIGKLMLALAHAKAALELTNDFGCVSIAIHLYRVRNYLSDAINELEEKE
jgi:hypothetical protein